MNRKEVGWGLFLVVIASYIIASRFTSLPSLWTVVFTTLFAIVGLQGFIKLNFTQGFVSLAFILGMYRKPLSIEEVSFWTLLVCGALIGVGFDMIFRNVKKKYKYKSINPHHHFSSEDVKIDNSDDGREVFFKNSMGAVNKYVNSGALTKGVFENSFGQCNVYFNNTLIYPGTVATIIAENSFGQMNIYIPKTWRVNITQSSALGNINVHGEGNYDMDAPAAELKVETSFGEINVYFE